MKVVKSRCNMCHPRCGINAFVEDGKIVDVEGMPGHPYNYMCRKGHAIPELVHAPDRLTSPMIKKNGKLLEVSWDEAFDFVTDKLTGIKNEYGVRSIVFHTGFAYVGTPVAPLLRRLSDAIGIPNYTSGGSFCWLARTMGFTMTVGAHICADYSSQTRCAVVWGHNPSATNPDLADKVSIVKERGGKVIVVDPRSIPLAKIADIHARVRPGTDCALALGILNVIIVEGLYDREFVEKWTVGFDKLVEHVKSYSPEKVAEITWVAAETIRDIGRAYGNSKTTSTSLGIAMDHSPNGIQTIRAITIIMAITGNIDVPGGNIVPPPRMAWPHLNVSGNITDDVPFGTLYPLFTKYARQEQQTTALLDTMISDKPYPIKALLSFACNMAVTWPGSNKVLKALKKLDLFVVCDIFMTDTARLADVVLPGVSFMERDDVRDYRNMGQALFFLANKAVEPMGNCMDDWTIVAEMGKRMGYGEYFPWQSGEELINFLLKPSGMSVDYLKQHPAGVYYGEKIFRKYLTEGFDTPSKKIEIYSNTLEQNGYEPLPTYHEPPESPMSTPEVAAEYPLVLIAGVKVLPYTHSQYRNLPSMKKLAPEPYVEIHSKTASKHRISNADMVQVETARGSITLKAKVTEDIMPGVVAVQQGWSEANPNLLTTMDKEYCDPISGYPGVKQLLCRVTKI